jgi:hypothetical protein
MEWLSHKYNKGDLPWLKSTYETLLDDAEKDAVENDANLKQIRKDLSRTFPKCKYFSKESKGYIPYTFHLSNLK